MRVEGSSAPKRPAHKTKTRCGDADPAHRSCRLSEWQQDVYDHFRSEVREHARDNRIGIIFGADNGDNLDELKDICKRFQKDEGKELPLVNGFSTTLSSRSLKRFLSQLPKGTHFTVNHPVNFPENLAKNGGKLLDAGPADLAPSETAAQRLPGLDKVWAKGLKGEGQTIAVIDSGIFPHPDLKKNVIGWVDLADGKQKMVDPFGHGTHIAGIAAGTGEKSGGKIQGVAPEAKLVGVRIGSIADAITALQWCIENKEKYNIGVVNMSLGDVAAKSWKYDPWALATQKAIEAGLTVVVAAGNDGPKPKSISTPGILPDVITVGAVDDKGTLDAKDDQVAEFSSPGPTRDGILKPDVLAPGVSVFGTLSPGSSMDVPDLPHVGKTYFAMSGTSQATPMIAGLAAILKQVNSELTPFDIRDIVRKAKGGAGTILADKAVQLAENWKAGSSKSESQLA